MLFSFFFFSLDFWGFKFFLLFCKCFVFFPFSVKVTYSTLAFVIPTPAVNLTFCVACNCVMFSAGYNLNIKTVKLLNSCWNTCVYSISNTKLTVVVKPPSKYLIFFTFVKRGMVSAKYVNSIFCSNWLNFHWLSDSVPWLWHSTYFSRFGIAPSIYFAVSSQSKWVMSPAGYFH